MTSGAMQNKIVMITGANSGIGKVTARALAGMGAHVILACRRQAAAEEAMQEIRRAVPEASLEFVRVDVSSQASVRDCAARVASQHDRLDVLINNAGIANVRREDSVDGIEMTFATNHLGPFLLTNLLLPQLRAARGRVINVASDAHKMGRMHWQDPELKQGYWVMKAYAQSKLCNILFTRALARRVAADSIKVNCLHPGAVATNIWPERRWWERAFSRVLKLFLISEEEGARTSIWLASAEAGGRSTGKYFYKCREAKPAGKALDDQAAEKLWQLSAQMTGVEG